MTTRVVVTDLGADPISAIESFAALEPMARPDPSALGSRDVLIAVRSAAVGWVDLLMTSGQYQHVPAPPYTPELEYAGVVDWVGEDARGIVNVGDAVLNDGFLTGPRSLGAYPRYGGFASYAVAPAEAVHRIPGELSFDQACNLLGSYETADYCLVTRGRLAAGETVLITLTASPIQRNGRISPQSVLARVKVDRNGRFKTMIQLPDVPLLPVHLLQMIPLSL